MTKQETINFIKNLIKTGEKIDVEFKESKNDLNKDVYESVCSFNNRDGGYIILGVVDKTKEICGVNPDKVDKMKKDFTTSINNANKINPPIYLTPEDVTIDDKVVIFIRVPEGTQLRRLNGRIYDRTYEGDIDITDNAELVYKMYARKQSTYFVNKVYPKLGLEFLDFDVIRRAKKMAMSRMDNHPWTDMSEEEILRSSGLILADPETGKEGITLAAILLFGKNSTIMSVLPQYKTDAIYRVKNMDRYDDREVIITNLVDSFRRLMDFGKKHLNDVFVTEGDQSISARDKILREVVSNILAHRDYANAYTAQFVIERDKLYSGGVPKFVEENTFEIIIPIENVPELRVGGNGTQDGTQDGTQQRILELVAENPKITRKAMAEKLNISVRTLQRVLNEIPNLHYVGTGVNGHWQIEKEQDDVSTN